MLLEVMREWTVTAADMHAGEQFRSTGSDWLSQRKRRPQSVQSQGVHHQVRLMFGRRLRWPAHWTRRAHGYYWVCLLCRIFSTEFDKNSI